MYASTRTHIHNAQYRFGSAGFSTLRDLKSAAMLEAGPDSLLVGFMGKKPITYSGAGGVILVAGARSGKLRDMLAYNICAGLHPGTMVMLDVKGELAAISRDQTPDKKFCIYRHVKTTGLAPWMECVQYLLHAIKEARPLCV